MLFYFLSSIVIEGARSLFFLFLNIRKKTKSLKKKQKQKYNGAKKDHPFSFLSIRKKQKAAEKKQKQNKGTKKTTFKNKLVMLDSFANCLMSLNVEEISTGLNK